jgi:hypothetical protein
VVRNVVVVTVLALLTAGAGCFWGKSGSPAVITGYVYDDATGEGIPGATVVLSPSNISVQTDADGSYRFENVPRGNYTVLARAGGYKNASKKGVGASPGRERWAKLFLKRVPGTDVDASSGN